MKCDSMTRGKRLLHSFLRYVQFDSISFIPSLLVSAVISVSFGYLLVVSWLRWGNLYIDTPRELWLPLELLKGRVLYRDLIYPYGFFPPYFQAFLYKVFGVHILTQVGCGIMLTLTMSIVLYKIARFFLSESISGLVVVTFLFVFAFGCYLPSSGIFNCILPYSFAALFFIVFVSLALYFFIRFILHEKRCDLIVWMIMLTLSFLCRISHGLVVWGGFTIAWFALLYKNRHLRRYTFFFCFPLLFSVVGYSCFIVFYDACAGFKESFVDVTINAFKSQYLLEGSKSLMQDVGLSLVSFIEHCVIIAMVAFACLLISCRNKKERRHYWHGVVGYVMIVFSLLFIYYHINAIAPVARSLIVKEFPQFYCVNVLFFIFTPYLLWRVIRDAYDRKKFALFVLFLIAFAAAVRTLPHALIHGQGYIELILAMVCYYVFFFKIVSEIACRQIKDFPRKAFTVVLACCFLLPVYHLWRFSRASYQFRTATINTDYGWFRYYGGIGSFEGVKFLATIEYLKHSLSSDDTVVVFPHGVSFNFFSHRQNPLRYYDLGGMPELVGQERIVSHMQCADIDYIVMVVNQRIPPAIIKIYDWILDNYVPIKVMGPHEKRVPIIGILKKKVLRDQNRP